MTWDAVVPQPPSYEEMQKIRETILDAARREGNKVWVEGPMPEPPKFTAMSMIPIGESEWVRLIITALFALILGRVL